MSAIDMPLADLEILNRISLQEGSLWEFYFLDLPKLSQGLGSFINSVANLVNLDLSFYKYLVQETSFSPDRPIDYEYDEATRKHYPVTAGAYSDFSITFRETEQFSAYKFLKTLHEKTYNSDKGVFKSGNPSITGLLIFYKKFNRITSNALGNFLVEPFQELTDLRQHLASGLKIFETGQIFTLENMTLKEIGSLSTSYTNTEPVTITGSFNVENVTAQGIDTFLGLSSNTYSAISSLL